MKYLIRFILLILISNLYSSWTESNNDFEKMISSISAIETLTDNNVQIKDLIYKYQPQIEYALTWRVRAIDTYKKLEEKEVLMASDISYLNFAAYKYRELRENLFSGIYQIAPLTNENVSIEINDKEPTSFKKMKKIRGLFTNKKYEYIQVNPNDRLGQSIIKKLKLGLVFALLLYDNYLIAIAPYEQHNKLRYIINESGVDPEIEGYLRKVSESYTNKDKMSRMIRAIKLVSKIEQWERNKNLSYLVKNDSENSYLDIIINGSPSYSEIKLKHEIKNESFFKLSRYNIFKNEIEDHIKRISNNATHQVSKLFGNTAGLIASRRGKMEGINEAEKKYIQTTLEPLDIMLEKAPFRLTDHLIPGYWSHVGLWCGNEADLENLGVWDELPNIYSNAVEKYNYTGPSFQKSIKNGHSIIEALRPGVNINTLNHFLNIDDIGVIRNTKLTQTKKKEYLINAFQQIGKDYDFNFDVESTNEIVCSELIYITMDDIKWNTKKTIGRYTISPDNVAQKLNESSFEPILLYIDGKKIGGNINEVFPTE